jgi:hypothetical protein
MNGHQHQSVDSKLHLIQLREQARISYCAAYHQVNGDFVKHPSLDLHVVAFRICVLGSAIVPYTVIA